MDDLLERRQAELEFIAAAYSENEAWCDTRTSKERPTVYRRLEHAGDGTSEGHVAFLLQLEMPESYPTSAALKVSGVVEEDRTSSHLVKSAFNTLPALLASCRQAANDQIGEEAVFTVLGQADDWMQSEWPPFVSGAETTQTTDTNGVSADSGNDTLVLGRRLIYSHHIISKHKRSDMRELACHYKLTGFLKIGWPGLVILEGLDAHCHAFYDDMRRWNWKYLVVRGEMQERVADSQELETKRCFSTFIEVDDMSVVADHCRRVGLESLFRTSMKLYDDNADEAGDDSELDNPVYGALIHVDHMNDAKSYRKWLRKTCHHELDVSLFIKQWYPDHDFSKRPNIFVGLVGDRESVAGVLKRWRTSRVDVDARGKPCLERMMTVLLEGCLDRAPSSVDWDSANADERVNATKEHVLTLVESIGGSTWAETMKDV